MSPFELKVYRKSLGISQTEAARRLGESFRTYWRRENQPLLDGSARINNDQLDLMAGRRCPLCGQLPLPTRQ